MGSPLTDIIAEGLEQLRSAASVKPKRRRLGPAMRLKLIKKGSDQSWIGVLVPDFAHLACDLDGRGRR